ncbi:MAG: hypothetical protein HY364_02660 [Candidatus Aenigmarchaeota archaeon]|nr:hypothetical protein [Candidatus Aenigmarchaeota archaeon]
MVLQGGTGDNQYMRGSIIPGATDRPKFALRPGFRTTGLITDVTEFLTSGARDYIERYVGSNVPISNDGHGNRYIAALGMSYDMVGRPTDVPMVISVQRSRDGGMLNVFHEELDPDVGFRGFYNRNVSIPNYTALSGPRNRSDLQQPYASPDDRITKAVPGSEKTYDRSPSSADIPNAGNWLDKTLGYVPIKLFAESQGHQFELPDGERKYIIDGFELQMRMDGSYPRYEFNPFAFPYPNTIRRAPGRYFNAVRLVTGALDGHELGSPGRDNKQLDNRGRQSPFYERQSGGAILLPPAQKRG